MGQATSQIEAHIKDTRADLGSNLKKLEQKVKSATDWKQHFQTRPTALLGVAFGGGVVLATMLGRRKNRRNLGSPTHTATDDQKHRALETWDNIKGALIGVAATRFKDFVGELVPGFHEQFEQSQQKLKTSQPPVRQTI